MDPQKVQSENGEVIQPVCEDKMIMETVPSDDNIPNTKVEPVAVKDEPSADAVQFKSENAEVHSICEENEDKMVVDSVPSYVNTLNTEVQPAAVKEDPTTDPFAYLDRRDFTSEKYKVEIRGLPKFYGFGELKKLFVDTLKLSCTKVKPPRRGCYYAYACFRTEQERSEALDIINGYVWKKSTLSAKTAQAAPDPLVSKRLSDGGNRGQNKKQKIDDSAGLSIEERLKKNVCPLWNVPYPEQQKRKRDDMRKLLFKLGEDLLRANRDLSEWMREQRKKNEGLPCPLLDIRSASKIDGYRNKCEFSIGYHPETKKITVGQRLGSYSDGSVAVGPLDGLPHIPERMKDVAKAMELFVEKSGRPPYDHETHDGFWKQITVRLGHATGELLLIAGMHPQDLTQDELGVIKKSLVEYFSEGPGAHCKVASLHFLSLVRREPGSQHPTSEHLWGQTHIHEILLGLKFRISPEAFFQVNTAACEELYTTIAEVADLSEDTTLLDVCCGTGTIGLCLSKRCSQVLGVELIEEAVKDAEYNAKVNGVDNCAFFAGRAEDILSPVIDRASSKELVAVVDPPRAGLHQKALVTLRRTHKIKRLVYVSCDPKAAFKNFVDLGRPPSKSMRGFSMVPVKAIPVDLFPHTDMCELVVYFERIDTRKPEERYNPEESNTASSQ